MDGYYDKEKGYPRTVTIEKVGYLDELEKQYEDPIAYFNERVQVLKKKKAERTVPISVSFSHDENLTSDHPYRKNFVPEPFR